jgi:Polysaccharide biosynthesis/export protein
VIIEFDDTARTGDYHMTMDPSKKDPLLLVPSPFPGRHIAVSAAFSGEATVSIPLDFTNDIQVSCSTAFKLPLDPNAYVIGPGDEVAINVGHEPGLSGKKEVRSDGGITLPLIGGVQAAGFTPSQLAGQIQRALSTYLKNPEIEVVIAGAVPRTLFDERVSNPAGAVLVKSVRLASGSHALQVMVRDLKTGAVYEESVSVEVK